MVSPFSLGMGVKVQQGRLIEYSSESVPLTLNFAFNPASITRTRSISVPQGAGAGSGGYDFTSPEDAIRTAQGLSASPESLSLKILLDATDRMAQGDPTASVLGIQPELDMLRVMMEPREKKPRGARTLAALSGEGGGFPCYQSLPVILFGWGVHMLPVFILRAQTELTAWLPSLLPYRAEVSLELRIIESANPFYNAERKRLAESAADFGG